MNDWVKVCRAHCSRIKYVAEPMEWRQRPNHAQSYRATSVLLDDARIVIPGLQLQCEFRPSSIRGDYASFTLLYRGLRETHRVFQLEVYPRDRMSHRDAERTIYGPHILLGDPRLSCVVRPVVSAIEQADDPRWIGRFVRHSRVSNDGANALISVAGELFGS